MPVVRKDERLHLGERGPRRQGGDSPAGRRICRRFTGRDLIERATRDPRRELGDYNRRRFYRRRIGVAIGVRRGEDFLRRSEVPSASSSWATAACRPSDLAGPAACV